MGSSQSNDASKFGFAGSVVPFTSIRGLTVFSFDSSRHGGVCH